MTTHNRRSIRLKNYDYSRPGPYFVTICTHNKACVLGNIVDGKMVLSDTGSIVKNFCCKTESHFANVKLDPLTIMPNHLHAIITVGAGSPRPVGRDTDTDHGRGDPAPTLGNIVGFLKYGTTKQANKLLCMPGTKFWQRNYYEHIIRDEKDYNHIYEYITNNPLRWELDSLHPNSIQKP